MLGAIAFDVGLEEGVTQHLGRVEVADRTSDRVQDLAARDHLAPVPTGAAGFPDSPNA